MLKSNAIKLLGKYGKVEEGLPGHGHYWAIINGMKVAFLADRTLWHIWVMGDEKLNKTFSCLSKALAYALHRKHWLIFEDRSVLIEEVYDPLRGLKRTVSVNGSEVNGKNVEWAALVAWAIRTGNCMGVLDWLEEHAG